MGRSKEEIQRILDIYNKAMRGDVDAIIEIWGIIEEQDKVKGGGKHGKNCKGSSNRNASKRE